MSTGQGAWRSLNSLAFRRFVFQRGLLHLFEEELENRALNFSSLLAQGAGLQVNLAKIAGGGVEPVKHEAGAARIEPIFVDGAYYFLHRDLNGVGVFKQRQIGAKVGTLTAKLLNVGHALMEET